MRQVSLTIDWNVRRSGRWDQLALILSLVLLLTSGAFYFWARTMRVEAEGALAQAKARAEQAEAERRDSDSKTHNLRLVNELAAAEDRIRRVLDSTEAASPERVVLQRLSMPEGSREATLEVTAPTLGDVLDYVERLNAQLDVRWRMSSMRLHEATNTVTALLVGKPE